jgi:hypothetical protein
VAIHADCIPGEFLFDVHDIIRGTRFIGRGVVGFVGEAIVGLRHLDLTVKEGPGFPRVVKLSIF